MAHIRILRDGYGMLCAAAALAVAAVLIPYAGIVVNGQDQTQLQWKILTELAETVDEKDSGGTWGRSRSTADGFVKIYDRLSGISVKGR